METDHLILKLERSRKVERARSKYHAVLFETDSPFKSKQVARKDQYKRQQKHRLKELA
jgi:hypothetical protein